MIINQTINQSINQSFIHSINQLINQKLPFAKREHTKIVRDTRDKYLSYCLHSSPKKKWLVPNPGLCTLTASGSLFRTPPFLATAQIPRHAI
jgi:hypothetical protein